MKIYFFYSNFTHRHTDRWNISAVGDQVVFEPQTLAPLYWVALDFTHSKISV